MKWQQGRATIDAMLGAGQVERVTPRAGSTPSGCSPRRVRISPSRRAANRRLTSGAIRHMPRRSSSWPNASSIR